MSTHEIEKITSSDSMISGVGRRNPAISTIYIRKYLYVTINFLEFYLKSLEENYVWR